MVRNKSARKLLEHAIDEYRNLEKGIMANPSKDYTDKVDYVFYFFDKAKQAYNPKGKDSRDVELGKKFPDLNYFALLRIYIQRKDRKRIFETLEEIDKQLGLKDAYGTKSELERNVGK